MFTYPHHSPAYTAAAGSLASESLNVTVREEGDEAIEGPIIMHSALLDPGREKGEYHSTEDMHIQIWSPLHDGGSPAKQKACSSSRRAAGQM